MSSLNNTILFDFQVGDSAEGSLFGLKGLKREQTAM